jgi:hypothetical protein
MTWSVFWMFEYEISTRKKGINKENRAINIYSS